MKLSKRLVLFFATLALFLGGGFYLGYSGSFSSLHKIQSHHLRILTENQKLLPTRLLKELASTLLIDFEVEVAEDPDSFVEKASSADILWARKDWILRSELPLIDFSRQRSDLKFLAARTISSDFFDSEEVPMQSFPLFWVLPIIQVKNRNPSGNSKIETLFQKKFILEWPFWGLSDFYSGFNFPPESGAESNWEVRLMSSSLIASDIDRDSAFWFPESGVRPLVINVAFSERSPIPTEVFEKMIVALLDPHMNARTAAETGLATTVIQAEELLPIWQRASSLRKIGLQHLQRP